MAPFKDDLLNPDGDFFGGVALGSDQNFEGDNQLIGQPDDTSLSSASDSEETYVSDKSTVKDLDFQLQGLSLLMGENEPTGDFTQSTLDPENVENLSGCLVNDFLEHKGNKKMEWKNAQALLTQMGIQLIHDTKKSKTEAMINKDGRKKANRELQNLSFNVNYEGSSSRRGVPSSP